MTAGDFQSAVNTAQAPAVEGDFASKNPRYSYDAGPGGLVAGVGGVVVGRFAWATAPLDGDGTPATVYNTGSGAPSGFVHREQQALIVNYLASSGMNIPAGFAMTLMIGGDFWVKNAGTTEAEFGQKAYANFADGTISFAAAGSPSGAVATAWGIAAGSSSFTGVINGNVLTASAVTGSLYNGTQVAGTNVAANTAIVSQLTGTALGAGTYLLNVGEQTIASEAMTGSYGSLTLTTVSSGVFAVGDTLTGATAGVTAGTAITVMLTGGGLSGSTGIVNFTQTSGNGGQGNLTAATNFETKYFARSTGLAGELVKMSEKTLG